MIIPRWGRDQSMSTNEIHEDKMKQWFFLRGSLACRCWWSLTPILTINITPNSMLKWGKSSSCVKNFIYNSPSSTCACRIICMQENIAKICKKVINMDAWSKWTWQEALGPLGSAVQHHKGTAQPQVALPCHWSMGVALEPVTSVHSSQFDQRTRFDACGFMGPLS